jgi:hypothetical protein
MKLDSLVGAWTGTAENNNGFDLEITITIAEPCRVGSACGTFTIPAIPCSGVFRLMAIRGERLELQAENKQGACGEAEAESLEMLSDGTLLYVSKGDGWEARGILERTSNS